MDKAGTRKCIEVMQAYVDGAVLHEVDNPTWNWGNNTHAYKVAVPSDKPAVPYPGMQEAFEAHYGQSFTDRAWRVQASVWAAAWKASKLYEEKKNGCPD